MGARIGERRLRALHVLLVLLVACTHNAAHDEAEPLTEVAAAQAEIIQQQHARHRRGTAQQHHHQRKSSTKIDANGGVILIRREGPEPAKYHRKRSRSHLHRLLRERKEKSRRQKAARNAIRVRHARLERLSPKDTAASLASLTISSEKSKRMKERRGLMQDADVDMEEDDEDAQDEDLSDHAWKQEHVGRVFDVDEDEEARSGRRFREVPAEAPADGGGGPLADAAAKNATEEAVNPMGKKDVIPNETDNNDTNMEALELAPDQELTYLIVFAMLMCWLFALAESQGK